MIDVTAPSLFFLFLLVRKMRPKVSCKFFFLSKKKVKEDRNREVISHGHKVSRQQRPNSHPELCDSRSQPVYKNLLILESVPKE